MSDIADTSDEEQVLAHELGKKSSQSKLVSAWKNASFPGAEHELQDSVEVNASDHCLLAAVADGVTHSFRSKTLADRLVQVFVGEDSPTNTSSWQSAWESLRAEWYKEHSPLFTTFHPLEQELFINPGCHATFHGVRIELTDEGSVVIDAFRRGDSIALWISEAGELVATDPEVVFGNRPETLGLPSTHPDWSRFHARYPALPAQNLVLATDALADYLIQRLETPDSNLVKNLLGYDQASFADWCREHKEGGLKADDYAYVIVSFVVDVPTDAAARPKTVDDLPRTEEPVPENSDADEAGIEPTKDGGHEEFTQNSETSYESGDSNQLPAEETVTEGVLVPLSAADDDGEVQGANHT